MTKKVLRFFLLVFFLANQSNLAFSQNDTVKKHETTISQADNHSINIDSTGQPVIVDQDTVFLLHTSDGDLSVADRAMFVSKKLNEIGKNWELIGDTLAVKTQPGYADIYYQKQLLIEVTQMEASFHGASARAVAINWKTQLHNTFNSEIGEDDTIFQYAVALGIILITLLLINYVLKLLFKRLKKYIAKQKGRYINGIKIKDFEIMDADDEIDLIFKVVFVIRLLFMLILASIVFPIIFSFFPVTKPITYKLIGYVYDPAVDFFLSVINYLPNLFTIIVIVYIVRQVLKYIKLAARRIELGRLKIKGFYPDWAHTTYELVRIVIIALSFVMLFPYLPGAQSDVFKGVSVFIGIIFSIGSTSVVGNLVAGLVLTYMRPFKIGDRIKINNIEGEIVEKSPFVLRIKTPKNEYITMPNANVLTSHIVNYNRSFDEGGVILFTEITIGYDVPWRDVHELLLKAADATEYLEKDPKPFVLQKALEDASVAYQINAYSKKPLYKDLIYSLMHQNIQDMFAEAGVEILSPKYVASRDGSKTTIPPTIGGKPNPAAEENDDDKKDEAGE